jgi:hypothetical protein
MIRNLVAKFTGLIAERSHSARMRHSFPIKLAFEPMRTTGQLAATTEKLFVTGETTDLSQTGIGFVVSSIRVRENYLVGQDRRLNAEIDLPSGKVRMTVIGRRYEHVGIHLSTERFLIGAEIVDIRNADREAYENFLRFGSRRKSSANPGLEMGGN